MTWKRFTMTLIASTLWTGIAVAQDVMLYEFTENMKLTKGRVQHRLSVAALGGFVPAGTPLCPKKLIPKGTTECGINVIASDDIDLSTGVGPVSGELKTVVHGDNAADPPELVVMSGNLTGQVNLVAAVGGPPLGVMTGTATTNRTMDLDFTAVFRLPFLGSFVCTEGACGPGLDGFTLRQLFCPADPSGFNTDLGVDLLYVDTDSQGNPTGSCINIQPHEILLGKHAMLRIDIFFD